MRTPFSDKFDLSTQFSPQMLQIIVAALAVLCVLFAMNIRERRVAQSEVLLDLVAEFTTLNDQTGPDVWEERDNAAQIIAEDWKQIYWRGRTAGIASAQAQSALREIAQNSGLDSIQISASGDVVPIDGNEYLRFELTARADSDAFLQVLSNMSKSVRRFDIREMESSFRSGNTSRIYIAGYLPYLPEGETDTANTMGEGLE